MGYIFLLCRLFYRYLQLGNKEKAEKFVNKARKLYPSQKVNHVTYYSILLIYDVLIYKLFYRNILYENIKYTKTLFFLHQKS